ncbi:putative phosphomannomutase PmmB [Gordonia spumicola]|uniref:Putative phosphomannomutase PmmB n=1 Tax=Gordonia spumicola TaxID=589161 RepID=A0A7I9VA60_9ACTN|nr:phospho-sugar mutase [Gordonia spumicola]GEE01991.1 putative phosphomannomutase PmmB [Gordonia spumicola]
MLSFGTAGLRGPVRDGPDGMNVENVTRATAGLAAWLTARGHAGRTVVVGRDARHGSDRFAAATRDVFAAAGFDVVALPDPGPTPLVAFACRALDAAAGVMITASHNPAADNGYKVYLDGGAQLVEPADREIEAAIAAVDPSTVRRTPCAPDERARGVRADYLARLADRFPPVAAPSVRIALTAMHGVGGRLAVDALARAGFPDVHPVAEQFAPDPDFPTVAFPNPEEPGATDLLLDHARRVDADLAIALDPDADRCAVGVRVGDAWRMLTGDETGALLGDAILDAAAPDAVVASSIVSGTLMDSIARARGFDARRTLTGFKWLVRAGEPLVYAYEEALGHCVDPAAVRDKDGVSAAIAAARIAQSWRGRGGLGAALDALMARYGVHMTAGRSVRFDSPADGDALTRALRHRPPTTIAGFAITVNDYLTRGDRLRTDAIELSGTDGDGRTLRVIARPSGTEPKMKFYGQMTRPAGPDTVESVRARMETQLQRAIDDVLDAARAEEPNR